MEKKEYFKKAIRWAKKKGFSSIRANHEGFEKPTSFTKVDEETSFVPDITGRKFGNKFYIEIALKAENIQKKVSKWKLMNTLASVKGGKLFLLIPRGHKAFVQRMLARYDLPNTQPVYIPNIKMLNVSKSK